MPNAWFDSTIAWISAHPHAAGLLIFLVAFCDALAVVGIVVPALPLLFAVGALVGLGHVDGPYAVICAALGAFAGDALSYWIGHRWGATLRGHWPFRRYPQLLDRGEQLFRRSGSKGIVIARFVGAVRPFVPAIAGMLRMPLKRYVPASVFAAVAWSAAFLAPGWVLGASYDAVAAVADRLALVLGTLLVVLALVWALVLYTWRWFAGHANNLLARALLWTRAHPHLGRYAAALIDPNRPESASLALLAVCLLAFSWVWFALLAMVLAKGEPLLLDRHVHEAMSALRNPLADQMMAALASLGDAAVLGPAAAVALLWLLWRRRWIAAAHWLAALAFGLALTAGLEAIVDMPRPSLAAAGFGFPSIAVTMATITLRFLRRADRARTAGPAPRLALRADRRAGDAARLRAPVPRRALAQRRGRRCAVRIGLAAGAGHRLPPPRGALVLDAAAGAGFLWRAGAGRVVACAARGDAAAGAIRAAAADVGDDHGGLVAAGLDATAGTARRTRRGPALALRPAVRRCTWPCCRRSCRRTAGGHKRRPTGRRRWACSMTTVPLHRSRCCRRRSTATRKHCCCCVADPTRSRCRPCACGRRRRAWPTARRCGSALPRHCATTVPSACSASGCPWPKITPRMEAVREALEGYALRESRHPHPHAPLPVMRVRAARDAD